MSNLGLKLSQVLKGFRDKSKERSQDWLAGKLSVSRATVNRWETKGAGNVTLDELERISKLLDQKPWDLIRPDDAMPTLAPAPEPTLADLMAEIQAFKVERVAKIPKDLSEISDPVIREIVAAIPYFNDEEADAFLGGLNHALDMNRARLGRTVQKLPSRKNKIK